MIGVSGVTIGKLSEHTETCDNENSLYPYFRDFGIDATGPQFGGTSEEFRQALRDAVSACSNGNVYLIEGPDVLTDIRGLTFDLIHPSDNGMIQMGRNLAEELRQLLR